jgi:hypothetical protein
MMGFDPTHLRSTTLPSRWHQDEAIDQYNPKGYAGRPMPTYKKEFRAAYANWRRLVVDWKRLYPAELAHVGPPAQIHPMQHLRTVDIGVLLKEIDGEEEERQPSGHPRQFGCIPRMALAYLARRSSSSFVERCNSNAKLVLGDHRPMLSDHELEALCMLRVNRRFMEHMHHNHPHVLTGKPGA